MKMKLKENVFYMGLIFLVFLGLDIHFLFRCTIGLMYQFRAEKGRALLESLNFVLNALRDEESYNLWSFIQSISVFLDLILYFCVIPGVLLIRKNTGLWLFEFYRTKSYRKFLWKKVLANSLKFSGAVFSGFLLYMAFLGILTNGHMLHFVNKPEQTFSFLFQFFSRIWVCQHVFLYELLIVFLYFFVCVFVYAFFSQCVALFFSNVKIYFSAWIFGCMVFTYVTSAVVRIFPTGSLADEVVSAFLPKVLLLEENPHLLYTTFLALSLWILVGGLLIFSQKKGRELGKGAILLRVPSFFEIRRKTRLFVTKYRVVFGSLLFLAIVLIVVKINDGEAVTPVEYLYTDSDSIFWALFLILFLVFSYKDSGFVQHELSFYEKKRLFFLQKILDYTKKWLFFLVGYGLLNLVVFCLLANSKLGRETNLANLWVTSLVCFVFFNLLYLFVVSGIFRKNYFLFPYLLCLAFFSTERIRSALPLDGVTLQWTYLNPMGSSYFSVEQIIDEATEMPYSVVHIHWLPYLCMIICYTTLGIFTIWYRNRKIDIT